MGLFGGIWGQKKKEPEASSSHSAGMFDWLKVDVHNHILPGIDDGSPDVETSLNFLRKYHELGFKQVIASPHIRSPLFPNNQETIRAAWEQLELAPGRQEIPVKLTYSAEYYIDEFLLELLLKDKLMPVSNNYVLMEVSLSSRTYINMEDLSSRLLAKGLQPILAHPERYLYWNKSPEVFTRLKSNGWLLQLNLMSLVGFYGKAEQRMANYLLQEDLVDFLGTDIHKLQHFDVIASIDSKTMEVLKNKYIINKLFVV